VYDWLYSYLCAIACTQVCEYIHTWNQLCKTQKLFVLVLLQWKFPQMFLIPTCISPENFRQNQRISAMFVNLLVTGKKQTKNSFLIQDIQWVFQVRFYHNLQWCQPSVFWQLGDFGWIDVIFLPWAHLLLWKLQSPKEHWITLFTTQVCHSHCWVKHHFCLWWV